MSNIIITYMATLRNTYRQSFFETGSAARTEVIAIPSEVPVSGDLVCEDGEQAVTVYAEANCYILAGVAPLIEGVNAHFVPAHEQLSFQVEVGERIAVVDSGGGNVHLSPTKLTDADAFHVPVIA